MKIISWNVNGIRASYKKGLLEFIERETPDILCLQETKAHKEQLNDTQINPCGLLSHWSSAERKGYSGTATFLKDDCEKTEFGIGIAKFDSEGRFVVSDHGDFLLYNIYFPNGGSGPERHQFKQEFLGALREHLSQRLAAGREIIVVGDYNVARDEMDVYDPVELATESGFLPEEREWFKSFLSLGFVDVWRDFNPYEKNRFTWWDQRTRARLANNGWRIDYICVSENLAEKVTDAGILDEQEGSDHCPVYVELDV